MSPVVLNGDLVVLRPFRPDELERVLEVHRGPSDGGRGHLPDAPAQQVRERIEASGSWSDGPAGLVLAIEAEGRLVGEIQARGGRAQLLPPGVFELGIELYRSEDRGHGIGTAAVVASTRYLFEEEAARRVQISTDVHNAGMRGVCERAGLRFEGVLRGLFPDESGEGACDYAMYGITRDDYEDVKTAWTSTS